MTFDDCSCRRSEQLRRRAALIARGAERAAQSGDYGSYEYMMILADEANEKATAEDGGRFLPIRPTDDGLPTARQIAVADAPASEFLQGMPGTMPVIKFMHGSVAQKKE